jgi:hypothetical protein
VWPFWIKDKFFTLARNRTPQDCPAHSPVTTPKTISRPTTATIMTKRKEHCSNLCVHHAVCRFCPSEFYRRRCKHKPCVVSHTQACALFTTSFKKIIAVSSVHSVFRCLVITDTQVNSVLAHQRHLTDGRITQATQKAYPAVC